MADDNNKRPNSRIDEAIKAYKRRSSIPNKAEVRTSIALEEIAAGKQEIIGVLQNPNLSRAAQLEKISELSLSYGLSKEDALNLRLQRQEHERLSTANKILAQSISTATSQVHTREDISRYSMNPSTFPLISNIAETRGTFQLEAERDAIQQRIDKQTRNIQRAAQRSKINPEKLLSRAEELEESKYQQAIITGALRHQKRLGGDTRQIYESGYSDISRLGKETALRDEKALAQSGKGMSFEQAQSELRKAETQLLETFKRFDAAIKGSGENADELAKEFKNAQNEFDIAKTRAAATPPGAGGGGLGSFLAAFSGPGLQAASAVNDVYSRLTINREREKVQLGAQFQEIANQQFFTAESAAKGNIAALMRLQGAKGVNKYARDMADAIENAELRSITFDGVTSLVSAVTEGASSFAQSKNAAVGIATGVGSLIKSGAQLADRGSRVYTGAVEAEAVLATRQEAEALQAARDAVPAYVKQFALDYQIGTFQASMGLGARRQDTLATLRSTSTTDRLAKEFGISTDQIPGLINLGQQSFGAMFNAGDITKAAELAKSGILAPEESLKLAGDLTSVGGSMKELEAIMKNAVATGMDSSKNVQEMTRVIGSMAAQDAKAGISTVNAALTRTGLMMDSLASSGIPANMRDEVAQDANSRINAALSNQNTDLSRILQAGAVNKIFNTLPGTRAGEALRRITPTQIQNLKDQLAAGGSKFDETAASYGLYEIRDQLRDVSKLDELLKVQTTTTLRDNSGGAYFNRIEDDKIIQMCQGLTREQIIEKYGLEVYLKYVNITSGSSFASGRGTLNPNAISAQSISLSNQPNTSALPDSTSTSRKKFLPNLDKILDPVGTRQYGGIVTSRFGPRRSPITGLPQIHKGIDIAANEGTPALAAIDGVIEDTGYQFNKDQGTGWGHYVLIRGDDGNFYRSSHLRKSMSGILKPGQRVSKGNQIGEVGNSGGSTNPHLDLSIFDSKGNYINPESILSKSTKLVGTPEASPLVQHVDTLKSGDPGYGVLQSSAQADAEKYKQGIESVGNNFDPMIKQMQALATSLNPENFKALDSSTINLNTAIGKLSDVVDKLSTKLGGEQVKTNKQDPNLKSTHEQNSNSKQYDTPNYPDISNEWGA